MFCTQIIASELSVESFSCMSIKRLIINLSFGQSTGNSFQILFDRICAELDLSYQVMH